MKFSRKLMGAAVAAGLAFAAAGAQAAVDHTFNVGSLPYSQAVTYTSSTTFFDDVFNFSLSSGSDVNVGFGEITSSAFPNLFKLSILDADVYQKVGNSYSLVYDGIAQAGPQELFSSFNTGLLGAGNYILKVSGAVSGIAGGGYVAQIAAVPEPSEYLMMLAGLGIVGYAVRRKRAV